MYVGATFFTHIDDKNVRLDPHTGVYLRLRSLLRCDAVYLG
jgi:hypothetical protein